MAFLIVDVENDLGAGSLGARAVSGSVGHEEVADLILARRDLVRLPLGVGVRILHGAHHDHAGAKGELGVADRSTFRPVDHQLGLEPECLAEPIDRGADIAIPQCRDDASLSAYVLGVHCLPVPQRRPATRLLWRTPTTSAYSSTNW